MLTHRYQIFLCNCADTVDPLQNENHEASAEERRKQISFKIEVRLVLSESLGHWRDDDVNPHLVVIFAEQIEVSVHGKFFKRHEIVDVDDSIL